MPALLHLSLNRRHHFQQIIQFADNTTGGLAEPSQKGQSAELLKKLFYFLPFLSQGESLEAFIWYGSYQFLAEDQERWMVEDQTYLSWDAGAGSTRRLQTLL
jgi:hypothetical protein